MEKAKTRKLTKKNVIIIIVAAVLVVAIIGFIFLKGQNTVTAASFNLAPQTTTLKKQNIYNSISVSGTIESAKSSNIYTTNSYVIKNIFVNIGDSVEEGQLLAELDTTELEKQITESEINYKSALSSLSDDEKSILNKIESARNSYEKQVLNTNEAKKNFEEAEAKLLEEFDSYSYDNTITDAKVSLDRKESELLKAEAELEEALHDFDTFSYDSKIAEAKLTLEKKEENLKDVEEENKEFDEESYQKKLADAKHNYETKSNEYLIALNKAWESESTSTSAEQSAENSVENAKYSRDNAKAELDELEEEYEKAKTDFPSVAAKNIKTATDEYKLALRSYESALKELEKAKSNAAESAYEAVEKAQQSVDDAKRSYEKALKSKEDAKTQYIEDNSSKLESAKKSYEESLLQLDSATRSFNEAEESTTNTTNIELKKLSLDELYKKLEDCKIYAKTDGVITEMNATVGAKPEGVLFVIEDCKNLIVTSSVKEYNLSEVSVGMDSLITTDATGDSEFKGTLSYISPKATSAGGSTSVDFEVKAAFTPNDDKIKIGMNAFLNIITESKENVFAVAEDMITNTPRGSYVYALEGEEKTEIPVTIGMTTDTLVEISGDSLKEGMVLVAGDFDYSAFAENFAAENGGSGDFVIGGMGMSGGGNRGNRGGGSGMAPAMPMG